MGENGMAQLPRAAYMPSVAAQTQAAPMKSPSYSASIVAPAMTAAVASPVVAAAAPIVTAAAPMVTASAPVVAAASAPVVAAAPVVTAAAPAVGAPTVTPVAAAMPLAPVATLDSARPGAGVVMPPAAVQTMAVPSTAVASAIPTVAVPAVPTVVSPATANSVTTVVSSAAPSTVKAPASLVGSYVAPGTSSIAGSYVAPAVAPQPPARLTEGIPSPQDIEQQKSAYTQSLDMQLQEATSTIIEQGNVQKQMLHHNAKAKLEQSRLQIEEQLRISSMTVDHQVQTQLMDLRAAAVTQKTLLEEQAAIALMDYRKKKAQEEMSLRSYQVQKHFYDAEVQLVSQLQQASSVGRPPQNGSGAVV